MSSRDGAADSRWSVYVVHHCASSNNAMSDYVKFTQRQSALTDKDDDVEEVVLKGNGVAKKHLVGRDTDLCTWVLSHDSASRRHAVITIRQDKRCVTIRDNKSSYGVYLNKRKLPPDVTVKLKKRDTISFGKSPHSWLLSDMHFLSEADLVGIDDAGIRAYLSALARKETRLIARPDDFVPLTQLIAQNEEALSKHRYEDARYLNAARLDPQQRLEVEQVEGELFIRDRRAHVPKPDEALKVREWTAEDFTRNASQGGTVVHATYFQHLNKIRNAGLSRTSNAFIHFYRERPSSLKLPGHDRSPNILVYVDVAAAAREGIRFFNCVDESTENSQVRSVQIWSSTPPYSADGYVCLNSL